MQDPPSSIEIKQGTRKYEGIKGLSYLPGVYQRATPTVVLYLVQRSPKNLVKAKKASLDPLLKGPFQDGSVCGNLKKKIRWNKINWTLSHLYITLSSRKSGDEFFGILVGQQDHYVLLESSVTDGSKENHLTVISYTATGHKFSAAASTSSFKHLQALPILGNLKVARLS